MEHGVILLFWDRRIIRRGGKGERGKEEKRKRGKEEKKDRAGVDLECGPAFLLFGSERH